MNDFMYASGGLYIMGNHYLWNQSMTRLFSTDKIYAMRPTTEFKMVPFLNYSWWFVVCGAGGIWEGRLISLGHNYFRCNSFQNIWPSAEWSQHRQYLNCYTQFNNPRRDMRGNKIWNQIEKSRFCDSFTYFCKSRVKYCNWESVSGLQMGIRRAH